MRIFPISLVVVFALVASVVTAQQGVHLRFSDFPNDWHLVRNDAATSADLTGFEGKFKIPLLKLTNVVFQVESDTIQINTMSCRNNADAEKLYEALVKSVGHANTIMAKENGVIEVISKKPELIKWIEKVVQPSIVHHPIK